MGLFKHKDKTEKNRPDLLNPAPTSTNPSPTPGKQSTQNNSFNDSTYYSSSDLSNADGQKAIQTQEQAQGKPPGTTITTTTTTTTTSKWLVQ